MAEKGGDGEACFSIGLECMLTNDPIRLFLVVRTVRYGCSILKLTVNRKVSSPLRSEFGLALPWHHLPPRPKRGSVRRDGSLSDKKVRPSLPRSC
jgi:hypothetical protein